MYIYIYFPHQRLKETISKEQNESMRIMSCQIENMNNRDRENMNNSDRGYNNKKKLYKNFGVQNYNWKWKIY